MSVTRIQLEKSGEFVALMHDGLVIGLAGPSAAGKSTLALALHRAASASVICTDDHFLPTASCPRFDLAGLPWPDGVVPAAFAKRGNADTNVPAAVDWLGVLSAVLAAKASSSANVVVDSHLLLGNHQGAQQVLSLCDHLVALSADGADDHAMQTLWRRKYMRRHLGSPSYRQLGVSEAEYAVYWEQYVWPRWEKHGARRVPSTALSIDCLQPTRRQADTLLTTGWFEKSTAGQATLKWRDTQAADRQRTRRRAGALAGRTSRAALLRS